MVHLQEKERWENNKCFQESEKGRSVKDELRLQVDEDTAEGLVVRAKRAPLAPVLDERDDCPVTGHAVYQSWCELSVTDVVVQGCSTAMLDC